MISQETQKHHAWMVFLGQEKPIFDKKRKTLNDSFGHKEDKKRVREYQNPYALKSRATRKLLRGIKVCLKSGMTSNCRIYDVMISRGFLNGASGRLMTKNTLRTYARAVRGKLGIVRKDKKIVINEMFLSGKSVNEMAMYLDSTPRYITQVLKRLGHKN